MVRVGQAWAGYGAEAITGGEYRRDAARLRPVLTWKSQIVHVKTIEAGTPVGYGSTWTAGRRTRIGLVPIGYADGYPMGAASTDAEPRPACVGVDVGSVSSQAVLLAGGELLSFFSTRTGSSSPDSALQAFRGAGEPLGVSLEDVDYAVGTGYGRTQVDFADQNISEITCHGRGAYFLLPSVRTVIDIGGQDTKAISIDAGGNLLDFVMNDKCAAGTGRFLEAMARSMEIPIERWVGESKPHAHDR